MALKLTISGGVPIFNTAGAVNAGGTVVFYDHGTTNYATVYSDAALTTFAPQQQGIDSDGRIPGDNYVDGSTEIDALVYEPGPDSETLGALIYTDERTAWYSTDVAAASSISTVPNANNDGTDVQEQLDTLGNFKGNVGNPGTAGKAVFQAATNPGIVSLIGIKRYTSAQTALTDSDAEVFTHGLGDIPLIVDYELVCTVAQHNYTVGTRLRVSPDSRSDIGFSADVTATNITIRTGTSGLVQTIDRDAKTTVILAAANWEIVVRAIYFDTSV